MFVILSMNNDVNSKCHDNSTEAILEILIVFKILEVHATPT